MMTTRRILIKSHMGLGDHIICNAIIRRYSKLWERIAVPVKKHNLASVQSMYADLTNVLVIQTDNDETCEDLIKDYGKMGYAVLRLGVCGPGEYNSAEFDKCFYKQAGLPFDARWNEFSFPIDYNYQFFSPPPYVFIHDDPSRGMVIQRSLLPNIKLIHPMDFQSCSIGTYIQLISLASEIHCIDSSFAILADSIPTKAVKKYIHRYARPNVEYPTYRNGWEIIT